MSKIFLALILTCTFQATPGITQSIFLASQACTPNLTWSVKVIDKSGPNPIESESRNDFIDELSDDDFMVELENIGALSIFSNLHKSLSLRIECKRGNESGRSHFSRFNFFIDKNQFNSNLKYIAQTIKSENFDTIIIAIVSKASITEEKTDILRFRYPSKSIRNQIASLFISEPNLRLLHR